MMRIMQFVIALATDACCGARGGVEWSTALNSNNNYNNDNDTTRR